MKTKYAPSELEEFKILLDQKLEQNNEQLKSYNDQLEETTENGKDENNIENSGFNTQVESLMASIDRLIKHNRMVENALLRIKNNVYGICTETGNLIDLARLKAVPTTTLSLEGKKLRDQKLNL